MPRYDRRLPTLQILRLPLAPNSVGRARRAVRQAAADAGLGAERAHDAGVAVSEAVTNAMAAHQQAECDAAVVVEAQADGLLEVAVTDAAGGFEPLSPEQCQAQAAGQEGEVVGGLGVTLMRALADDIDFERHEGTTVRMRFAPRA